MSEQEKLENHFREIAHGHEALYEPADWADMQSRLQAAGLTATSSSPLRGIVRRSLVLVALLFVVGIQISRSPTSMDTAHAHVSKNLPAITQNKPLPTTTDDKKSTTTALNATPTSYKNQYPALPTTQTTAGKEFRQEKSLVFAPIAAIEKVLMESYLAAQEREKRLAEQIENLPILGFATEQLFLDKTPPNVNIASNEAEIQNQKNKSDYQHIDFYTSESFHANTVCKFGTGRIYNILAVGYQFSGGGRAGIGFGFGKELKHRERGSLNLEAISYYVKENQTSRQLNLLLQGRLQCIHKFTPNFSIFAGGSVNMLASDYKGEDLVTSAAIPSSWVLRSFIGGTSIKVWTGLNLGISLKIH